MAGQRQRYSIDGGAGLGGSSSQKLPDFETLLASGASIKVVSTGSRDIDTLGESSPRFVGNKGNAREAALMDIERELSRISPKTEAKALEGNEEERLGGIAQDGDVSVSTIRRLSSAGVASSSSNNGRVTREDPAQRSGVPAGASTFRSPSTSSQAAKALPPAPVEADALAVETNGSATTGTTNGYRIVNGTLRSPNPSRTSATLQSDIPSAERQFQSGETSYTDKELVPPSNGLHPTHSNGTFDSSSTSRSKQKTAPKRLTKSSDETTVSTAMRKTSGFFKRAFGVRDSSPYSEMTFGRVHQSTPSISAPSTPLTASFSQSSTGSQPPVPSIPSAYASVAGTSASGPRRNSLESEDRSVPRREGDASSSALHRDTSLPKGMGRLSQFSPSFRSSASSNELKQSTRSSTTSEDARLQRELEVWQINQGVLASGSEDFNSSPIKGRSPAPKPPQTPPHSNSASTVRSPSSSNSVLVSGSLPSPNLTPSSPRQRSERSGTILVGGSMPSPIAVRSSTFSGTAVYSNEEGATNGSPASSTRASASGQPHSEVSKYDPFVTTPKTGSHLDRELLQSASGKMIRKRTSSSNSPSLPGSETRFDRSPANQSPVVPTTPQASQAHSSSRHDVGGSANAEAVLGLGIAAPALQRISETSDALDARSVAAFGYMPSRAVFGGEPQLNEALLIQQPSKASDAQSNGDSDTAQPSIPPRSGTADLPMYLTAVSRSIVQESSPVIRTPKLGITPDEEASSLIDGKTDEKPMEDKAQELASKCWTEDETFLKKEKIAEWLGGMGSLNQAALVCYMSKFDFTGLRLDNAFRRLCEKLYLKAETQQVDRILSTFSSKYYGDNPDTIFAEKDIIHAATYALLLLNTDLHVADVANRMSRSDFIHNTMSAIQTQLTASPTTFKTTSPLKSPNGLQTSVDPVSEDSSPRQGVSAATSSEGTPVLPRLRSKKSDTASANSSKTGLNDPQSFGNSSTSLSVNSTGKELPIGEGVTSRSNSLPTIHSKAWELEVEHVLKEIYTSVKATPIMQPLEYSSLAPPDSNANSPYSSWGAVNRTPSRRSQTSFALPDRSSSYNSAYNKRSSVRGFLGASHESLRAASPAPSAGTSMSGGFSGSTSFGSALTAASSYYPATMGFASNLSHTIIREQQEEDAASDISDTSATDEELALLGAPWAKEGILQRKHYWEAPNRRSRDKNWLQVFAVIAKGDLKMFKFGGSSVGSGYGGGVGGGNWLNNAQIVGEVSLQHSLCSAMPPPGYNRSRPHVLVLTLSNGGSYFFQAGTEDLVNEWVLTCNYWAGRTSKEPLTGGVSNMDYGWNTVVQGNDDHLDDTEDLVSVRSGLSSHSKKSRRSYAGSVSRYSVMGHQHHAAATGADRLVLKDWIPPQPPATASTLSEDAQFEALKRHTTGLKAELERHQDLRLPMQQLYSPRSLNAAKATSNWEKKSRYLLAELVKYETYIEALKVARAGRQKRRDENQVKRLLEKADKNSSIDDLVYSPSSKDSQRLAAHRLIAAEKLSASPAASPKTPKDPSSAFVSQEVPEPVNRVDTTRRTTKISSGTVTTANSADFYEAKETVDD